MSGSRFERPPELYVDHGAAERRRVLGLLLAELRRARAERADWYVWVVTGRPELTPEEYARSQRRGRAS